MERTLGSFLTPSVLSYLPPELISESGPDPGDTFDGSPTRSGNGARSPPNVPSRKRSSSMTVRSAFSSGSFSTTRVRPRPSFRTTTPVRRYINASSDFHRRHRRCRSSRRSDRSGTVSIATRDSSRTRSQMATVVEETEELSEERGFRRGGRNRRRGRRRENARRDRRRVPGLGRPP